MSSDSVLKQPGTGDFDFLVGTWEVANRRLVTRLAGCTEWEEFPGRAVCTGTLFDGAANLDEITFPTLGTTGLTLRLFDPARLEWSLYWVSSRTGLLQPPVRGRFGGDGRGVFHGDDIHEGVQIRCRFIWSDITADSAYWEQAFSADDGESWETNWTMYFHRSRASTQVPGAMLPPVG